MSKKNSNIQNQVILALLLGFLGLSPIGEPHLIGKLKWIEGGAIGMKPIDWFDFRHARRISSHFPSSISLDHLFINYEAKVLVLRIYKLKF